MCFGGQPEAPVNKPAYAPGDAYKHFNVTQQEDGKEAKKVTNEVAPASPKVPTYRPQNDSIRM